MHIDEAVHATVRVRSRHKRQDGEQRHMRQAIQLAFGPSRVLDLGKQRQKRRERSHGNLRAAQWCCPSRSQRFHAEGILYLIVNLRFHTICDIPDSPGTSTIER